MTVVSYKMDGKAWRSFTCHLHSVSVAAFRMTNIFLEERGRSGDSHPEPGKTSDFSANRRFFPNSPRSPVILIPPEREKNLPVDKQNLVVAYYALSGLTSLSSNPPPAAPGVIHILPLRGLKD